MSERVSQSVSGLTPCQDIHARISSVCDSNLDSDPGGGAHGNPTSGNKTSGSINHGSKSRPIQ